MDGGIERTIQTPMSDDDIKHYLGFTPVIKYSELKRYNYLDELLPRIESSAVLLYEDSPNTGHWVCISKPKKGVVEYFDSYGGKVDGPLKWTPKQVRIGLGEGEPLLSRLFDKAPEKVVYNKIDYQKQGSGINDCGRFCVLRILKMRKGMDLNQFYAFMKDQARQMKSNYDVVVSTLIT